MEETISNKFNKIRAFVFDVDGVLTNSQLLLLDNSEWLQSMNIKDGFALKYALDKRYKIGIISGSGSEAIRLRLEALGITDIFLNIESKRGAFEKFQLNYALSTDEILYMGDDIPDLVPMTLAGLACCPKDAVEDIKEISDYVSNFKGGEGCVRDVIEKVLKLHGNWNFKRSDI